MAASRVFSCPYCARALVRSGCDYVCAAHHTFPIARSGYVNLCPSAKGGDTLTMLTARRRFLDGGHYRSLQRVVATTAKRHLHSRARDVNQLVMADIGCGDGSHLAEIGSAVKREIPRVHLVGLDVSKDAARMTARRDSSWEVAVADVRRGLPLVEGSAEVLLNLFAPRNAAAFSRALTSSGIAVVAFPSEDHLVELRDALGLLRVEPMKLDRLVNQSAGYLALADVMSVDESRTFDATAIEDILMMTPNAWHLTDAQRRRAAVLTRMAVTVSFRIAVFRRGRFYCRFCRTSTNDSPPLKRASSGPVRARNSSSVARAPSTAMTTLLSEGGQR